MNLKKIEIHFRIFEIYFLVFENHFLILEIGTILKYKKMNFKY